MRPRAPSVTPPNRARPRSSDVSRQRPPSRGRVAPPVEPVTPPSRRQQHLRRLSQHPVPAVTPGASDRPLRVTTMRRSDHHYGEAPSVPSPPPRLLRPKPPKAALSPELRAALNIVLWWKRCRRRRREAERSMERFQHRKAAILLLRAVGRGWRARRSLLTLKRQGVAAVKIQTLIRVGLARNELRRRQERTVGGMVSRCRREGMLERGLVSALRVYQGTTFAKELRQRRRSLLQERLAMEEADTAVQDTLVELHLSLVELRLEEQTAALRSTLGLPPPTAAVAAAEPEPERRAMSPAPKPKQRRPLSACPTRAATQAMAAKLHDAATARTQAAFDEFHDFIDPGRQYDEVQRRAVRNAKPWGAVLEAAHHWPTQGNGWAPPPIVSSVDEWRPSLVVPAWGAADS